MVLPNTIATWLLRNFKAASFAKKEWVTMRYVIGWYNKNYLLISFHFLIISCACSLFLGFRKMWRIIPFSSMRKLVRCRPSYLRPYNCLGPQTPYLFIMLCDVSAIKVKGRLNFVSNFLWLFSSLGLMPTTSKPFFFNK